MSQSHNSGNGAALEGLKAPSEPPRQANKDWHASITSDLRNHMVEKLVKVGNWDRKLVLNQLQTNVNPKAIFPSPDPAAIQDQRIRDLFSYARKVEKDMFEGAPNKEAYYHLLAEKIYKLQKEQHERKMRRVVGQQVQQVQQASSFLEKDGQEEKRISPLGSKQAEKEIGADEEEEGEFCSWEQIEMDDVE